MRGRLNWDTIGIGFSIAIIAAACFVLFHLLQGIDIAKVGTALRATPSEAVIVAGLLVAASYVTLTFYDFFALRTIGQDQVPYRVAAFTGFLAYTFGHNLGATVLTAGVVRLRIYKAWGLGLIEVAKVAFITGLNFGSAMPSCSDWARPMSLRLRARSTNYRLGLIELSH